MITTAGENLFVFFFFALSTHRSFTKDRSGFGWRINVIVVVEFFIYIFHRLIIGKFIAHSVLKLQQIQFELICLGKFIRCICIIRNMIKRLNHIFINFNLFGGTNMTKCLQQTILPQLQIEIIFLTSWTIIIKALCSMSWRYFR